MADVSTPLIQQVGGSVGIGTGAPTAKLHIVQNNSGGVPAIRLSEDESTIQGAQANTQIRMGGNLVLGAASTAILNTNNAERIRIKSDGNVGINATDPSEKLHINNGTLRIDGTTNGIRIFKDGNDSVTSHLYLANAANNRAYGWQLNADGSSLNLWTYNGSVWANKSTYKADGNVGIGTTSPSVKFHNVGSSIIANNTSIDPDAYSNTVVAGAIADGSGWGVVSAIGGNAGTGHSWAIGTNGGQLYFAYGNGSTNDSFQTYMQVHTNRNLFLVPTSGNVGIGTTSPVSKLTVNGTIVAGGEIGRAHV